MQVIILVEASIPPGFSFSRMVLTGLYFYIQSILELKCVSNWSSISLWRWIALGWLCNGRNAKSAEIDLGKKKRALTCQEGETFVVANRPNAVGNRMFLVPMLSKLARCENFHLPHLEDLRMEVQTLFEKCGLPNESKLVYQTSVELKKLVGFIKRRVNRKEVTKEAGFGEICFEKIFLYFQQ